MDIQRLGSIPFESAQPEPEPAKAGEARPATPLSRDPDQTSFTPIPSPGPDLASATPIPIPGSDLISATPIQLPITNPEAPGQPGQGPHITPGPQRGEAPPAKFMDTRLEIAAVKADLLGQIGGPIVGQGTPTDSDPVRSPLAGREWTPEPPPPPPDMGGRTVGQLEFGRIFDGSVPMPGPKGGPDPGPGVNVVFNPGLRAEQDVPPTPDPEPEPPEPPIPERGQRLAGEGQWGTVPGGAVPTSGPKGGPDPVPVNVVFTPGLRAEQDVPPAPPDQPPPPPPDDPEPTPPNPEREFLNPALGHESLKAQLLQELNTLRAETAEPLPPDGLLQAGGPAGARGPVGPRGNRAGEDEDPEEPIQVKG